MEEKTKSIYEKLIDMQQEFSAPKNMWNDFGKYSYRSAESMLQALKPLLLKNNLLLMLDEEMVNVGDRNYIKATAKLVDPVTHTLIEVAAYAREDREKKSMDGSQMTGASSSYARKYALGGMFLVDDTKDADATNRHEPEQEKAAQQVRRMSFPRKD